LHRRFASGKLTKGLQTKGPVVINLSLWGSSSAFHALSQGSTMKKQT
jgi:hypothetical protein